MDFTPTEDQAAARDLAARIFGDLSTHDRLSAAGTGSDATLWKTLCSAGLVAAVTDVGLLGLVLLLEEQGRTTAQVPFAASCVYGLLAVAAHGSPGQRERLLPGIGDGSVVVSGALPAQGGVGAGARGGLSGTAPVVPWLQDATHVLVADDRRRLWLVRTADARCEPVELTAPWSAGRLTLDGTPAERLGGDHDGAGHERVDHERVDHERVDHDRIDHDLIDNDHIDQVYADVVATARTAFAGLQAGVCAGSLARAVAHTNTREQFGRPLAAKQAVQLRAADAYMDTEAIRLTAYEAAWRRDEGLPYAAQALTAAWWASEAGQRVVHTGQHLHGGAGADLEHPVHRHFLWGRQLDAYLGCGSEVLQELGELIAYGEVER
ncbi:acyl-CoA dehydrogenase [Streptomyces avermitilis]|uniref:Acyl-CoA dehydrogenase n=1 Tax=Streptomyces avermitilis TaxID=33903 RepID=A0A4D4MTX6_STRAX|nr:acyl-CoA dehydrogenase family protein [Streptomyces avermitilis]KUN52675.1 acyl-CoA dehydrogenase [Streptomyces avermitilis]OOV31973.1 acyl-CoA dehydrogenase [Streptomyces avermitilis]BBJ52198.1 acyl-CoA dehydrogenase [Streptomyces avermitilis]GDY64236.1 acyl-CoA dehydrogenase [Streptomyces avermitilis]GDY75603.1 acyl-CoA dehydrogenase [Streptomyces avermitilis]